VVFLGVGGAPPPRPPPSPFFSECECDYRKITIFTVDTK
jgi:hypothetical protein